MGFHDGELSVQRLAGVSDEAARLVGMLDPGGLSDGAAHVLARQTLAALTARDRDGRLWTSPLLAPAGFLDGSSGATLHVAATPRGGDPLADLPAWQQVGLVAIDLANRRRIRVNGRLSAVDAHSLTIEIVEAFGNCPKYIRQRAVDLTGVAAVAASADSASAEHRSASSGLDDAAVAIVSAADTFFVGTTHAQRGPDSSHRGGTPGFVRVERGELWWPDYPGNNMFTSFGNLAVDPTAALLFVDFGTGATLHLSGRATLEWGSAPAEDTGTDRQVRFVPERVVQVRTPLPARFSPVLANP